MSDKVRRTYPAPVKCKATSKRTGRRCGRWAVPGNVVCVNHGAMGGPIGGRAAAEELHAVRRIEALVTDQVHRQMAAQGWPSELLDAPPPNVRPSEGQVSDEALNRVMQDSMAQATKSAVAQFQALMAARRAAEEAAGPQPVVIPGEVVERDQVAEDIERLEARPTTKRVAEAARLRQAHDPRELTLHSHAGSSVAPGQEPGSAPPATASGARPATRRTTANHLGIQPTRRTA